MAKRTLKRLVLVTPILLLFAIPLLHHRYKYQWTKNDAQTNGETSNERMEVLFVNKHLLGGNKTTDYNPEMHESKGRLVSETTSERPQRRNVSAPDEDVISSLHPVSLTPSPDLIPKLDDSTSLTIETCTSLTANTCNGRSVNKSVSCNNGGVALSLSFRDQQTWACGNLFGLQRWARTLNLMVVEPFLVNTELRIPSRRITLSDLPLSKLYDMDHWNEYARKTGSAPSVSWECFLHIAPKKLILVYLKGLAGFCNSEALRANSKLLISSLGFQVVREVCFSAQTGHRVPILAFNQKILANFSVHEVTIVFQEWSQRTIGEILDMDEAHRPMALASTLPLTASKWIKKDVDEYISRHLEKKFIAILFRTEWVSMYSSVSVYKRTVLNCLNKTIAYMKVAETMTGTSSVFLGLDIGKYGSVTITPRKSEVARDAIEKHLFRSAYPDSRTTIPEWEQTFEDMSQSTVPGYIALLQKSIAVRANCLLLMGSGSFHRQARDQYIKLHPKRSEQCYLETSGHCEIFKAVGLRR